MSPHIMSRHERKGPYYKTHYVPLFPDEPKLTYAERVKKYQAEQLHKAALGPQLARHKYPLAR
jgi:hypothetical protein